MKNLDNFEKMTNFQDEQLAIMEKTINQLADNINDTNMGGQEAMAIALVSLSDIAISRALVRKLGMTQAEADKALVTAYGDATTLRSGGDIISKKLAEIIRSKGKH